MLQTIQMETPEWAEPLLEPSRYKCAYGGRGGSKSWFFADLLIDRCMNENISAVCIREVQRTLSQSVKRLIETRLDYYGLNHIFNIQRELIKTPTGGIIIFQGMNNNNADSIKSLEGFDVAWVEEAQSLSEESLNLLRPTLRKKDSEIWFSWNPRFEDDPVEVLFRSDNLPDDTIIVNVNYPDNPWFPDVLRAEMEFDKKYHYDKYLHVWEGDYFDTVENVLVPKAWFDACVDAHLKLGFEPIGIRYSSHDPADEGDDAKGFAFRHGSVVLDIQEKNDGDINAGCDWATDLALQNQSDAFTWDSIGVGAGLKRQVSKTFQGKPTILSQFVSSEGPDNPEQIFEPIENCNIQHQQKNKDLFKNKRAQYYWILRDRIYRTYKAVVHGEYHDPDKMLSLSSNISMLPKLRSELCRIPMKPSPNGFFELYTKLDMKSKFRIDSPNLADSLMMLMRVPVSPVNYTSVRPQPINPMGRRKNVRT